MSETGKYATFLFGTPTALEGVGRIFDFAGSLNTYNLSADGAEADLRAMYADWAAVGDDMRAAMNEFAEQVEVEQTRLNKARLAAR